jgi:hypothetical protein
MDDTSEDASDRSPGPARLGADAVVIGRAGLDSSRFMSIRAGPRAAPAPAAAALADEEADATRVDWRLEPGRLGWRASRAAREAAPVRNVVGRGREEDEDEAEAKAAGTGTGAGGW